jgi:DNA transformation protein
LSAKARTGLKSLGIRNIGPNSEQWLLEIGVASLQDLRRFGAAAAYAAILRQGSSRATLNLLYSLEAAVRDLDWRELPASVRREVAEEARSLLRA